MQLLEVILQQQLASDEAAVVNVLNVLSVITPSILSSSASQRLWIARINTLLERPKHYGARWAGLCLAHRTALLNRELLVGSAQTWISFALPLLSV
jgi:pre-rRNA-processing protein RIX1